MTTIEGFDVSSHNAPSSVPWREARFGFVRVSHGLGLDTRALEHLSRAHAAGVTCLGAYHYLRGDRTGYEQARVFWARVEALEAGLVPLALAVDLEDLSAPAIPWARKAYAQRAADFVRELAQLIPGRPCAVYGSPGYLEALALPSEARGPLWAAHWGAAAPLVPKGWSGWTIHQHAVTDNLDRNRFAGDEDAWGTVFALRPLSYDVLGGVATAIQRAAGGTPEHYSTHDEGPVIGDEGTEGGDHAE